jgi:hypothetical protein
MRTSYACNHRIEWNAYYRKWKLDNPEKAKAQRDRYRLQLRKKVFEKLGGAKCANCGCDDIRYLEINHVNGGGTKESHNRRWLAVAIIKGYRQTDDLNVLCKVCNNLHALQLRFGPEVNNQYKIIWNNQMLL